MKITLEFDHANAADNFIIWWLDGGGEQYLNYESDSFDILNGYLRIHGSGELDNND